MSAIDRAGLTPMPAVSGGRAAIVRDVLGRVAAVLGLVGYMAGPGYAIIASPQIPDLVR